MNLKKNQIFFYLCIVLLKNVFIFVKETTEKLKKMNTNNIKTVSKFGNGNRTKSSKVVRVEKNGKIRFFALTEDDKLINGIAYVRKYRAENVARTFLK